MTAAHTRWPPSPEALRAAFDAASPGTVGIEDEVMLLDPHTLDLVGRATQVMDLMHGDARYKLELPASQIEIVTPETGDIPTAARALFEARRDLALRTTGSVLCASAGVHPFSAGIGELNRLERYERTIDEYGPIAHRQLVCALQVHVAVGDADRALAVYNAARSYLPLVAALAANGAYYEGRDSGLASMRPKIGEMLPRQGIPPPIASWQEYADAFRWGSETGSFPSPQSWWWELRLHPVFGTLEFRVPDGQSSAADAAAVAALIQALVIWLGDRHDAGVALAVAPTWQIEENRWSACRHGVEGTMIDMAGAGRHSTRELLHELLDTLAAVASRLGSAPALERARGMIDVNGAIAQRRAAEGGGARAVARWLTERFLDPPWEDDQPAAEARRAVATT